MKYYVTVAILASLAICLLHLGVRSTPKADTDLWDAALEANQEVWGLQADLYRIQILQWKARVRESGGMTPAHVAILLELMREAKARARSLRIQIWDLEE